jgi:predicted TPR repeat methyltransferase
MEQRLNDPKAATFHHSLAALAGVFPSAQVPTSSVADLFERYAERFDDHLRGTLRYGVPELLADAVAAALTSDSKGRSDEPNRRLDVFDLGCGTGLCGPLLRPMAATLVGVDLSPAMIERARGRGAYDRLEVGELTDALRKSPRAWDLLAAADVVIYTGDLSPFFEAAGAALRPGGLLAFSVEAGGGDRYYLQAASRRYAHSEPYLRRLASIHGFDVVAFNPIPIRLEKGKPVPGYLLVLRLLPQ